MASKEKVANTELFEKRANPETLKEGAIPEMLYTVDNLTQFEL